jgi:hypothetical protein
MKLKKPMTPTASTTASSLRPAWRKPWMSASRHAHCSRVSFQANIEERAGATLERPRPIVTCDRLGEHRITPFTEPR